MCLFGAWSRCEKRYSLWCFACSDPVFHYQLYCVKIFHLLRADQNISFPLHYSFLLWHHKSLNIFSSHNKGCFWHSGASCEGLLGNPALWSYGRWIPSPLRGLQPLLSHIKCFNLVNFERKNTWIRKHDRLLSSTWLYAWHSSSVHSRYTPSLGIKVHKYNRDKNENVQSLRGESTRGEIP